MEPLNTFCEGIVVCVFILPQTPPEPVVCIGSIVAVLSWLPQTGATRIGLWMKTKTKDGEKNSPGQLKAPVSLYVRR
jgi:hypothetical protein